MSLIVDNLAKWAVSHRATAPGYAHAVRPTTLRPAHVPHRSGGAPRDLPHRTSGARDRHHWSRILESPLAGSLVLATPLIILGLIRTLWALAAYAWLCGPHSTQHYCESWSAWTQHYLHADSNSAWLWNPHDAAIDYDAIDYDPEDPER